jgi:hypothetical protein
MGVQYKHAVEAAINKVEIKEAFTGVICDSKVEQRKAHYLIYCEWS